MSDHDPYDSEGEPQQDALRDEPVDGLDLSPPERNGWIAWFSTNHVAANLLMVSILFAGLVTLPNVKKEVFPEIEPNLITVAVAYPGATPTEVEEGICQRIEEAVEGVTGVDVVRSSAAEGAGQTSIETLVGADIQRVFNDVKNRVDSITTFPEQAEEPIVQRVVLRKEVINVAIHGNARERTLKELAERIRDELLVLPEITQIDVTAARNYEISIEVSEEALRRHGLTFDAVATAVRRSSLDLPAGSIKSEGGEILVRSLGQAYRGDEFARIALLTAPDGSRVTVGDVATVVDGFEDTDLSARFDGESTVLLKVYRVGDQDALAITQAVRDFVADRADEMPAGVSLTTWRDESKILRGRIDLLLRNAATGLVLVLLVLSLFLQLRLAFWVALGIPISFLGSVALMPTMDVSVNVISLFAFLVVLGIVVDDAIVVGENVFKYFGRGLSSPDASIKGSKEVAAPVTFAVLTTVVAFLPMFNVPGTDAQIWRVIPLIVIPTLLFSLVESKLILPAHLALMKQADPDRRPWVVARLWMVVQGVFSNGLMWFIRSVYQPSLETLLRWRYATLSCAVVLLGLTVLLAASGWVRFTFFPQVDGDNAIAQLTMPRGTPVDETSRLVARMERAAREVQEEVDREFPPIGAPSNVEHMLATVGAQPFAAEQSQNSGQGRGAIADSGGHLGEINVQLVDGEQRTLSSEEFTRRWRERVGQIPEAIELSYASSYFSTGKDIDVQLAHDDLDVLQVAAEELEARLATYAGVIDIGNTFRTGKPEIRLAIKPTAEPLGLTLEDLARQVRAAFYGEEAQRILRGRDEIKVMVRYPEEERRSLSDLENLRVRTPAGDEVPFHEVASASWGRGYATIERSDLRRVVRVQGEVDDQVQGANADQINQALRERELPALLAAHDGLTYSFEGDQKQKMETLGGLASGFLLALFLMYALLAIPFRSYLQPLLVMSAIPFGLVGAIWGHVVMGFDLSIMSMFGIIALSGVVVNDSLVLVDFINKRREDVEHGGLLTAVRIAGGQRFRPILLTSLTTFAGLTPLMLEKSFQAKFLIPMAVSLAFGVMFATIITLVIVPCLYLMLEDIKHASSKAATGVKRLYGMPTRADGQIGSNEGGVPSTARLRR
jgi:multidrug efflux pump subunit AcrB